MTTAIPTTTIANFVITMTIDKHDHQGEHSYDDSFFLGVVVRLALTTICTNIITGSSPAYSRIALGFVDFDIGLTTITTLMTSVHTCTNTTISCVATVASAAACHVCHTHEYRGVAYECWCYEQCCQ